MTDSEKFEYTTSVFSALIGDKQDRLKRGMILRQAMHDAVARGEDPQGYRVEWLKSQSLALVRFMMDAAEEFDALHPDDKASVSDILDILATTSALFRTSSKE